ncbi:MAG: hypothetical protein ACRDWT_19385 [Jatrophihabitantaceae bacterium]
MDDARPDPANPPARISFQKATGDQGVRKATGGQDEPPDVGEFRPGSPVSQWALARYLVGRAIGESVGNSLMIVAVLVLALAALIWWAGSIFWAVVVGIIALGVLALRALMLAVLRRLTATRQYAPLEERLRALVSDTRGDVLRELRRIGLPGHTWTLPLLGLRLFRSKRRQQTLERLKTFQLDRAVPRSRIDELHLLLASVAGRPAPPAPGH